jgi:hypothetical protein
MPRPFHVYLSAANFILPKREDHSQFQLDWSFLVQYFEGLVYPLAHSVERALTKFDWTVDYLHLADMTIRTNRRSNYNRSLNAP